MFSGTAFEAGLKAMLQAAFQAALQAAFWFWGLNLPLSAGGLPLRSLTLRSLPLAAWLANARRTGARRTGARLAGALGGTWGDSQTEAKHSAGRKVPDKP